MSLETVSPRDGGTGFTSIGRRPRRPGMWWILGGAVIALLVGISASLLLHATTEETIGGPAFLEPVPNSPRLDPQNVRIVRGLLSEPGTTAILNTYAYGQPVYEADGGTRRYRVHVLRAGQQEWGDNVLAHQAVPIPEGAQPSSGDDGKLIIVDKESGRVFDLWRAKRVGSGWQAEWGGIYALGGSGSSRRATYGDGPGQVSWPQPLSRGTGSGISSLAGLVRAQDLKVGVIHHALVFSSDRTCGPAQTGPYRWPATTTDGWVTDAPCIPEGARLQLDPRLDLDTLPGLSPLERMVGVALQKYGAYCVDMGGARMALIAEVAHTPSQSVVMDRFQIEGDYTPMARLPLSRVRVLATWDGR